MVKFLLLKLTFKYNKQEIEFKDNVQYIIIVMTTLDIVNLIEANPITKLSSDYNVKLLVKIKENFTDMEQQLFLSSFYCYLNYHPTNDFVVDLDKIWKWLGFSVKIKAKTLLEKHFICNKDYINLLNDSAQQELDCKKHGGHNKETLMLNITTFKLFCLLSDTKKSKEIHYYFIKLEDLLHEVLEEEAKELKQQLSFIEFNNLLDKQKSIEQTLVNQFPINTECIYFGTINNTNESNDKLIKFGHTNNLHNRLLDHHKNYDNFVLLEAFKVQNKVEIENLIKTHPEIKKHIRNIIVNGKNKTEIIAYSNNKFTINDLTKYIKEIINSKTYCIDNYNKLLNQNEELLSTIEELKSQLQHDSDTIIKQTIEINELKNKLSSQDTKIQLFEKENQSVYQNSLLSEDEQTNKFNEFINLMCIVRSDVEESSTNMEGAYRIWNKIKPKKETFHAFKTYLDTRFKPCRLSKQTKNQVVNGYIGITLKTTIYKKKHINNDVETFLFQVCIFTPSGKILNSTLVSEFQRWTQIMNKPLNTEDDDLKNIKEYLNNCEYVLKATVWTDRGSNEGYYGISLKADEYKHKNTSSTGKKVEKIEYKTGQLLCIWDTIAKAAEDETISASKMSRNIKNKVIINNDYYYQIKN
jgi:hypothetical protein